MPDTIDNLNDLAARTAGKDATVLAAAALEIGMLRVAVKRASDALVATKAGWWHNPERDSLHHYTVDGKVAVCHREFNSEWQPGDNPARRCRTCQNHVGHLGSVES